MRKITWFKWLNYFEYMLDLRWSSCINERLLSHAHAQSQFVHVTRHISLPSPTLTSRLAMAHYLVAWANQRRCWVSSTLVGIYIWHFVIWTIIRTFKTTYTHALSRTTKQISTHAWTHAHIQKRQASVLYFNTYACMFRSHFGGWRGGGWGQSRYTR